MSRRNRYFLVARDRDTNTFDIVPITDSYGSSLEEIDLFTTCFDKENTLSKVLKIDHKVESDSLDLFVVHQSIEKGKPTLFIQEVLYSDSDRIRSVAKGSLKRDTDKEQNEMRDIFREFCSRMMHDQLFYNMVLFGHTNLYSKFIRYFSDRRFLDSYGVKFKDGGWIFKSYPTIRGMVEAFHLYENDLNGTAFRENKRYRDLLEEDLLKITGKEYNPQQISLFDFMNEEKEAGQNGRAKRKRREGTK